MSALFPSLPGLYPGNGRRFFFAALAGVVAVHVVIGLALINLLPAGKPASLVQSAQPMNVRLIDIQPDLPLPVPVKPAPKAKPTPPARIVAISAPVSASTAADFVIAPPPESPVRAPLAVLPAPTFVPTVVSARFDAAYLNNPKPVYPAASRRLGEEGKVILRVHVDAGGQAETVEIKTSSGFARLDAAAREAVVRWHFVPARRGDEPVAAWVLVPIVFNLEG